jgi:predicted phosphoadenosine phosphosulfate sulfurtransferase|tara:strand:- start:328 stop:660 length:333 start_codon:yes stop_codon:yes gene_type:complete
METFNRKTENNGGSCGTKNHRYMDNRLHDKIIEYIKTWEKRCYKNGIPDEAPTEIDDKVPSYKRICFAILKNDNTLKTLGYTPRKSKYYSILKRIEIDARNKPGKQLKLF